MAMTERDLSPLYSTLAAKLRIVFRAGERWRANAAEPLYRGRLGFRLKQMCCPFPSFRTKPCDDCGLADKCLYLKLFAPISNENASQKVSNVRPFLIATESEDRYMLKPGDQSAVVFTLFGPAIRYSSLFIEAAAGTVNSLPLAVEHAEFFIPESVREQRPSGETADGQIAWPLSDWIASLAEPAGPVALRFLTPVCLKEKNRPVKQDIGFELIVKHLLRRLRDMKRAYGADSNMGAAGKPFFAEVKAVRTENNRLGWRRKARYSYRQEQSVFLNGFEGEIVFSENAGRFINLLKAGEIVHIGKGTSSGNGRMRVMMGKMGKDGDLR